MVRPRAKSFFASIGLHATFAAVLLAIGAGTMMVRRTPPRQDVVIESRFETPAAERVALEIHEVVAEEPPEAIDPPEPEVFTDLPLEPEPAPFELASLAEPPPPIPFGKTVVVRTTPPAAAVPPAAAANPPAAPAAEAAAAAASSRSSPATAPSPLSAKNVPPEYPSLARRRGFTGVVVVRARVGIDGRAVFALVVTSSGHAVLDAAALDAVRRWSFEPARREDGAAVEGEIDLPIRFEITNEPPRPG